jgi:tetratricopeptide (TPR) repeat protein
MTKITNYKKLKEYLIPLYQQNKHVEALKLINNYLKSSKINPKIQLELAFVYYHIGKLDKAIKIYKSILQEDKTAVRAMQFLSRVYAINKDPNALPLAQTAQLLFPDFVMTNNLANIYDALGMYKEANLYYKQTLKLTPSKEDELVIKTNIANFYRKFKKEKQAREIINLVLKNKRFVNNPKYKDLIQRIKKEYRISPDQDELI